MKKLIPISLLVPFLMMSYIIVQLKINLIWTAITVFSIYFLAALILLISTNFRAQGRIMMIGFFVIIFGGGITFFLRLLTL